MERKEVIKKLKELDEKVDSAIESYKFAAPEVGLSVLRNKIELLENERNTWMIELKASSDDWCLYPKAEDTGHFQGIDVEYMKKKILEDLHNTIDLATYENGTRYKVVEIENIEKILLRRFGF